MVMMAVAAVVVVVAPAAVVVVVVVVVVRLLMVSPCNFGTFLNNRTSLTCVVCTIRRIISITDPMILPVSDKMTHPLQPIYHCHRLGLPYR